MTRAVFFLLVSSLAALTGCKDVVPAPDSLPPMPSGAYTYSSFDSNGVAIVRGWFTLVYSDPGTLSGEWHFLAVSNHTDIGPQTGDGRLTGSVSGTMLYVNLNPNWVDNNVFLSARLDTGLHNGIWQWSTFIGPTNQGRFIANQLAIVD